MKTRDGRFTGIDLTPGQRLRIRYLVPGQRQPREMVASLMEANEDERELTLSLRPMAGTQKIKYAWIIAMWATNAPLKMPEIARESEIRLF